MRNEFPPIIFVGHYLIFLVNLRDRGNSTVENEGELYFREKKKLFNEMDEPDDSKSSTNINFKIWHKNSNNREGIKSITSTSVLNLNLFYRSRRDSSQINHNKICGQYVVRYCACYTNESQARCPIKSSTNVRIDISKHNSQVTKSSNIMFVSLFENASLYLKLV